MTWNSWKSTLFFFCQNYADYKSHKGRTRGIQDLSHLAFLCLLLSNKLCFHAFSTGPSELPSKQWMAASQTVYTTSLCNYWGIFIVFCAFIGSILKVINRRTKAIRCISLINAQHTWENKRHEEAVWQRTDFGLGKSLDMNPVAMFSSVGKQKILKMYVKKCWTCWQQVMENRKLCL